MLIDERAHFGRCGSSSPAKNTLAAFRISFARRSSETSRRKLLDLLALLAGQDVLAPALVGLDLAHVFAQRLRTATPRSAATCAIGRPDSNTSRAPRSNNSCEYFLARGMTGDFSFRQANPGLEVSVKPRMAQATTECPGKSFMRVGPDPRLGAEGISGFIGGSGAIVMH